MAMRWTDAEKAQLAKLVAAGLTFGQIAHRIPHRSRSAIAGQVWRRGK